MVTAVTMVIYGGNGGNGDTRTINQGSDPDEVIPDPSGEIDGGNNIDQLLIAIHQKQITY